jgi:hypothetical protein
LESSQGQESGGRGQDEQSATKSTTQSVGTGVPTQTWNNPALSGRMLLVRNDQETACYELPAAEQSREDF